MASNGNGNAIFGHGQKARQLSLRDQLALDPIDLLKVSMKEAIDASGLSRAQIVDGMNRLATSAGLPTRTTEAMLDKWVARGSRGHIISVRDLPTFCRAVGSLLPLNALLPPGAEIVSGEDLLLLQWARAEAIRKKATRQARKLAQEAGIQS
ncbi:MAG: hypothetical protein AAGU11_13895 [Syntrophobacteraceae bacterium]